MSNPYEIHVYQDHDLYIKPGVLHNKYVLGKVRYRLHTPLGIITGDPIFENNSYTVFASKRCWVIEHYRKEICIPPNLFSGILTNFTPSGLHHLNLSGHLFQLLQKVDIKSLLPCWKNNSLCSHTILLAWINYCKGQGYIFKSHSAAWSSFVLHYQRDNYPNPNSTVKIIGGARIPSGQPLTSEEEVFPGDVPTISFSEIVKSWSKLTTRG